MVYYVFMHVYVCASVYVYNSKLLGSAYNTRGFLFFLQTFKGI